MRIQVKLYASLGRYAPQGLPATPFEVEISDGACLQDLINLLNIPPEETKVAFINGLVQEMDWKLKPDDQVGIFPPIGGG